MKPLSASQREAMRTFVSTRRPVELSVESGGEVLSRAQLTVSWICRLAAAGIMLETLFFKFTAHPESVWIFTKMNMEAWGRYGQGLWELFAAILLFTPRFVWLGALLTLGAMGAALLSHLAVLGIAVQGDGGLLFAMGCVTFLCGTVVLWIHQQSIPYITRLDDFPE